MPGWYIIGALGQMHNANDYLVARSPHRAHRQIPDLWQHNVPGVLCACTVFEEWHQSMDLMTYVCRQHVVLHSCVDAFGPG